MDNFYSLTYYDKLTKLFNKEKMHLEFSNLVKDNYYKNIAFILIDIDNFGYINNTLGYEVGDMLLKKVADCLIKRYLPLHKIARLNSDEFLLVYLDFFDKKTLENEVKAILKDISKISLFDERKIKISASVGIAIYNFHGIKFYDLLRNADTALYNSKQSGKNCYRWYAKDMQINVYKDMNLINEIEIAIRENQFEMYYQPIVDIKTEKMKGVEALVRWKKGDKIFSSPKEFIPVAESSGQMKALEKLIINNVFSQLQKWNETELKKIFISVNLSAKGLIKLDLVESLKCFLRHYNVDASQVEFEFTETALMDDLQNSIDTLKELKALGFKIALDDFGTGYSSLNYLKNLPIDKLKLDKTFVDSIEKSDKDMMIVKSIIDLGHNMGLEVVAEGVERDVQVSVLKVMRCNYIQGYYYAKPMPAEQLEI